MKNKRLKAAASALCLGLTLSAFVFLLGAKDGRIGREAALAAALEDAGLTLQEVTDTDVEYEKELGAAWYDVEFDSGLKEYDYRVDAYTGEILNVGKPGAAQQSSASAATEKLIGLEAALTTALDDAGLKLGELDELEVRLKQSRTELSYHVEFEQGLTEYSYHIDAVSGEILRVRSK